MSRASAKEFWHVVKKAFAWSEEHSLDKSFFEGKD